MLLVVASSSCLRKNDSYLATTSLLTAWPLDLIKIRVNLGGMQRRNVHTHLIKAEDPAADQGDDQIKVVTGLRMTNTRIHFSAPVRLFATQLCTDPLVKGTRCEVVGFECGRRSDWFDA